MILKRFGFIVFLFFTTAIQAQVEDLQISATLNRDTIVIGDRVNFSVKVTGKGQFSVLLPLLADTIPGGFHVLGNPSVDSSLKDNQRDYNIKFPVTVFGEGVYSVKDFPLYIRQNSRTDTVLVTSNNNLIVQLVPHDSTLNDIKDIKPPLREPIRFSEVAPWAGFGLLLVAVIVLLFLYIRNRKQNKPFLNIFKPKEPAHVIALRELQLLEEQRLWDSDNHKQFYTKLVDILRNYLEGRFGISAPEQTTSEILLEVEKLDYDFSTYMETLREMLFTSDLVKFAKHSSTSDENFRYLKFAIEFVLNTKPDESINDEAQANGFNNSAVNANLPNSKPN